jgi:NAD(P)H dehydrogenase (quinone)
MIMIVVTGATGKLGHLVIAALLKKMPASSIIAAVRNMEKARDILALGVQVRYADYNMPSTWDDALRGADRVLLISSNEIGQRTIQHRSVIDAASRARVTLLAYTSILHADTSPLLLAREHRETEATLRGSGVPFVLLRHGWYTENYTSGVRAALARGAVFGCAGNGRISSAARADYAEADAAVLTAEDQDGRIYELAGDTSYTLTEFAAEISRQSGKNIRYMNLSETEYKHLLVKAGLPVQVAAIIADSDTGVSEGGLFDDGHQLSKLIGRSTTSLAKSVAAAAPAELSAGPEVSKPEPSISESNAPVGEEAPPPMPVREPATVKQASAVGKGQAPVPVRDEPAIADEVSVSYDRIPVRLTAGRKAWLEIPTPLYVADKERLKAQIDLLLAEDEE